MIFICAISIPSLLYSQETKIVNDTVYNTQDVENVPQFSGGQTELVKFLSKNIKYPAEAREKKIEGIVVLKFVVNENGKLSNIQVTRSVGGGCDEEAIRVMEKSPRWIAAVKNDIPVKSYFNLPIKFKLGSE